MGQNHKIALNNAFFLLCKHRKISEKNLALAKTLVANGRGQLEIWHLLRQNNKNAFGVQSELENLKKDRLKGFAQKWSLWVEHVYFPYLSKATHFWKYFGIADIRCQMLWSTKKSKTFLSNESVFGKFCSI